MSTEIVVARYNENLLWLTKLPKNIKIFIYNKGEPIDLSFLQHKYELIVLPNIGRESHTYLYHIINNYNNLPEITIFCQGDSIFHSPDFINLIKNRKYFEGIQPLSAYYWPEGEPPTMFSDPPIAVLNETKHLWIKGNRVHVEYMNNDFITTYPHHYKVNYFMKMVDELKEIYKTNNIFKYYVKKFKIKNINFNKLFPASYAGLFAVKKNVILQNSKKFYENILDIHINDERYLKTFEKKLDHGLFLEKLWLVIFNYKKNNKNYESINVKNYPIFDSELNIKNNSIDFKLFSVVTNIFCLLVINKIKFTLQIARYLIYLKANGKKYYYKKYDEISKEILNLLKDYTKQNININIIKNNILVVSINNKEIFNIKIMNNANLEKAIIYDLNKENKFSDNNK
jgi:hypothetical protein